jgi:uncharacterized protein with PQ loop repeat
VFGITPEILGMAATFYGVGAAFAALLQARQMLRRRTSHDVSARFFAAYTGGYAIWLLYGVSIGSVPLIVVDAVGLCCGPSRSRSRSRCGVPRWPAGPGPLAASELEVGELVRSSVRCRAAWDASVPRGDGRVSPTEPLTYGE